MMGSGTYIIIYMNNNQNTKIINLNGKSKGKIVTIQLGKANCFRVKVDMFKQKTKLFLFHLKLFLILLYGLTLVFDVYRMAILIVTICNIMFLFNHYIISLSVICIIQSSTCAINKTLDGNMLVESEQKGISKHR